MQKDQWAFEGLEYPRTVTVYSLDNMIKNLKENLKMGKVFSPILLTRECEVNSEKGWSRVI